MWGVEGVANTPGNALSRASALNLFALLSHTHDAAAIVSGTFDADRIPDLSSIYQPAGSYQALDADLTAIAALSGTGVAQRTGSDTWAVAALIAADIPDLAASKIASGTFDNARVNWESPGTLGSTTPNTAVVTALAVNGAGSASIAHFGTTTPVSDVTAVFVARASGYKAAVFRGDPAGSGRIFEYQNNDGSTIYGYVDASGRLFVVPGSNGGSLYVGTTSIESDVTAVIRPRIASNKGMIIKGFSTGQSGDLFDVRRSDNVVLATIAAGGATTHRAYSGDTNAVRTVLTIDHNSSNTPAAGFGSGLLFTLKSSTTTNQNAGRTRYLWEIATHASRRTRRVDSVYSLATETDVLGQDVEGVDVSDTQAFYFGRPTSDGTTISWADGIWRIVRDGDDLVFQRRESAAWVTKSTIAA